MGIRYAKIVKVEECVPSGEWIGLSRHRKCVLVTLGCGHSFYSRLPLERARELIGKKSSCDDCGPRGNPPIKGKAFRKWVLERMDTMLEDEDWVRDNPEWAPVVQSILDKVNANAELTREEALFVEDEISNFEDVLRGEFKSVWEGAKQFLVENGLVREMIPGTVFVTRGRPEWFTYKGKKYIDISSDEARSNPGTTRKEINQYISSCLNRHGALGCHVEVATGGKHGWWQGEEVEGKPWGGDLGTLDDVRRFAQPGDRVYLYVYKRPGPHEEGHGELDFNLVVRIPDPARGIVGECKEEYI